MQAAPFLARYPTLFHVTEVSALDSIRRHGLLSAVQLVESSPLPLVQKVGLVERNRAAWTQLPNGSWLRLQMMGDEALRSRLSAAIDTAAWRRFINGMVFLCVSKRQAASLRRFEARRIQAVLCFETADLYRAKCRLLTCAFNNGAIDRAPVHKRRLRDFGNYRSISEYEGGGRVREVTVPGGIPAGIPFAVLEDRDLPEIRSSSH